MSKTLRRVYILFFVIILSVLAVFALQSFSFDSMEAVEVVGKNTFTQTMVQADGSTVNFFASGDQYFNYLHDKNGYILLRDNGYLVYAQNNGKGRPIPTKVRYTDAKIKISSLTKMAYSDIDFVSNPDLRTAYPQSSPENSSLSATTTTTREIVNIVIYICFQDESPIISNQEIEDSLNGNQDSLADYYDKLSFGKINVKSINPINSESGEIFIYKDEHSRDYYKLGKDNGKRQKREKELLNNAVEASREYFELQDLDISTLNEGYIDAVNFLVSGAPHSEWGGMLWPHSWDLDDISAQDPATIANYKVKRYSFNFMEQLTVGLLAHEFAHVLGVPDLYHYEDSHSAVAHWDLMHYEADIPQFMLTHLRDKYLQVVEQQQIQQIEYNGDYSLIPTIKATQTDVLAYKIYADRTDEYFMVEYRQRSISSYDSSLPGSGLIVYRIKEGVEGNRDALKQNSSKPDEVYILRPDIIKVGLEESRSRGNLNKAYLSPTNEYFKSVGRSLSQKPNSSYDETTIYYTNGKNSGIRITAKAITDDQITFNVQLGEDDEVDNSYFENKLALEQTKFVNDNFSGVVTQLVVEDMETSKLNTIIIKLKDEAELIVSEIMLNKSFFIEEYNNNKRRFIGNFVIGDKGIPLIMGTFEQGVWYNFNQPKNIELYVVDADNDCIFLSSYDIEVCGLSWEAIVQTMDDDIDAVEEIEILTLPRLQYEYGEALDLSGAEIKITMVRGSIIIASLSFYAQYLSTLNSTPDKGGWQTITLSIGEAWTSFDVYMKDKKDSNLLIVVEDIVGIDIDHNKARIVLDNSITILEFINVTSSYLDVCFRTSQGYLDIVTNGGGLLHGDILVEVVNFTGVVVESFVIFIKGDLNNDGKFDEEDIPLLTQELLQGRESIVVLADINGDGQYTLTDLILWVKRLDK